MASIVIRIRTLFSGQGANQARRAMSGVSDELRGMAASAVGPAALATGILAVGAAFVKLGVDSVNAAEEAKVASAAFVNLSGGANIATANLNAMRRATGGLISQTEQMGIANQLLGMNIVQTASQLEQVVSVSARLGAEFKGLGARDAADEFAIMIANMSVARLDSFGLSSGAVRKRIEELKSTVEGMTPEMAFLQATMEESEKTVDRLGPPVATTANAMSTLGAAFADFKVVLGGVIDDGGLAIKVFGSLSDALVLMRSALGDDSLATRIAAFEVELSQAEQTLQNQTSGLIQSASQAEKTGLRIAKLTTVIRQLTEEQDRATVSAEAEQAARQAAIASEDRVIENVAKRAEAAKKLADTQEQFSQDVIDLQNDTQDSLDDSRDQFNDDELRASEDHIDALDDIGGKGAKNRIKLRQRLEKDLGKVEKNLQKSLIKLDKDQTKRAEKLQSDSGKKQTEDRKRKQIDTLGDERLFQFGLRQLEADGNGIAIRDALERRAIEQQIASEKAEFEQDVEKNKRKDQLQSLQAEGTERRQQLEEQAAERRADLEDRNVEAGESLSARIAEEINRENEGFLERQADLTDYYNDKVSEIREGEQEGIAEIAKALTATEELTNTQLDQMVSLAGEFGKDFGTQFADGMTEAFSERLQIDAAIAAAATGGLGLGAGAPSPIANGNAGGGGIFAGGGIVPGSPGQARSIVAHGGEEIANPNIGQAVVIDGQTFAVREAGRLAAAINAQTQRNFQEFTNELVENLS